MEIDYVIRPTTVSEFLSKIAWRWEKNGSFCAVNSNLCQLMRDGVGY